MSVFRKITYIDIWDIIANINNYFGQFATHSSTNSIKGWSTTWDRKVTEEFLLKVTSENRQLQKKLFSEADKKQSKSGGSRSESRSQSKSRRKRKLSPSEAGDSNNSLSVSIDNESISSGSGACGGPPSGVSSGPSGAKAAKVQPSPSISGSIISNCNSELGNLLWGSDNWSGGTRSVVHVF